jgi:hypothetical protein
MIVIHCQSDEIRIVDNPADVKNSVESMELEENVWTSRPILIPDRPLTRWEVSRESLVLVLWKPGEGDWITQYYEAKVMKRLYDETGEEMRSYFLDLKESGKLIMPEHFIVADATRWKK